MAFKIDQNKVNHIWNCICRAVGTFARALDCSSSIRQPSLHMSAAAASRDITLVRGHVHPHKPRGALYTHAVQSH